MPDSHSLSRAGKHISRFFSKPFTGANKPNLKELDKILRRVTNVDAKEPFAGIALRQGQFDFTWLTFLKPDELGAMQGEWVGTFASSKRGRGPTATFAQAVTVTDRDTLLTGGDDAFWKGLQSTKDRYRALGKSRVEGFFSNAQKWVSTKKADLDDYVHHNQYIGPYLTAAETVDFVFEDATMRGAQTDLDRKILGAGGIWKTLKSGGGLVMDALSMAAPTPGAIKGIVKKGASVLNHLGGLVAGMTDLVRGKEADFRALSARFGLDQHIDMLKRKYLGAGVIEAGDTLERQMAEGPQRLEKAAEITLVDLDMFRTKLKHSLWWCETWKQDIAEIKKDIERPSYVDQLTQVFGLAQNEEGVIKPSMIRQLQPFVEKDREALRAKIAELEKNVKRYELLLGDRVRKLNILLAAYDTRKSIAAMQSKTAAMRVRTPGTAEGTHMAYDALRSIAHEASSFDRSKLRSAKLPHPSQRAAPTAPGEADKPAAEKLDALLVAALADRREYVGPEDPDEDPTDVDDWM